MEIGTVLVKDEHLLKDVSFVFPHKSVVASKIFNVFVSQLEEHLEVQSSHCGPPNGTISIGRPLICPRPQRNWTTKDIYQLTS